MKNADRIEISFEDRTFPLQIQYFNEVSGFQSGQKPVFHSHSFNELVVVLSGSGKHCIDETLYSIKPGDVYLLKGLMRHYYADTKKLELINIYYQPDILFHCAYDLPGLSGYHALFELEPSLRKKHGFKSHLTLNANDLSRCRSIMDQILEEQTNKRGGRQFMMNACWQELQVFLSRCYSENKAPELVNLNRISRVLIHIEKHYAEDLTLTSLAKLANMSKSSLLREFRKTTGLTPFDFVIKRRIRASRELLEDKSLKIYEVANSAGFRDSNYFSRKFRETFGLSPKDFRKTLKP